jgi:hypothetical protein
MSMYGLPFRLSHRISVSGFDARVAPSTAAEREYIREKLHAALQLIQLHAPVRFAYLRRDVLRIYVGPIPALGQWITDAKMCALNFDYLQRSSTVPGRLALTIIHEGMHARLRRAGFGYDESVRARIEDLCICAEVIVARRVPDGGQLAMDAEQRRTSFDAEFWTNAAHHERMRVASEAYGWLGRLGFQIGELLLRLRGARQESHGIFTVSALWAASWLLVLSPFTITQWVHARKSFAAGAPPIWALILFVLSPALWGALYGAAFALWITLFGQYRDGKSFRLQRLLLVGFLCGISSLFLLGTAWASLDTARDLVLPWQMLTFITGALNTGLSLGTWALMTRASNEALP